MYSADVQVGGRDGAAGARPSCERRRASTRLREWREGGTSLPPSARSSQVALPHDALRTHELSAPA